MKDLPEKIYLCLGDIGDDVANEESFSDLAMEEISWCIDKQDKWDIEYTLSPQKLKSKMGTNKAVGQIRLGEKIREIINDVLERNMVGADFAWVLSSEILNLLKEMGMPTDNEEIV